MSSERHLHPAAMLIGAIRTVRRWISGLVFPGIAPPGEPGFQPADHGPLPARDPRRAPCWRPLWGFLSWRATTYEVTGSSFRLRQGVVQKNERTIPLDHVQSVDTVQGIIQRLFGVYEVRIETAGGGASEPDASLSALDREAAQTLRRRDRRFSEGEVARRPRVRRSSGGSRRGICWSRGPRAARSGSPSRCSPWGPSSWTTSSRRTWSGACSRPWRRAG